MRNRFQFHGAIRRRIVRAWLLHATLVAAFLLLTTSAMGQRDPDTVSYAVGDVDIVVRIDPMFVDGFSKNAKLDKFAKSLVHQSNDLIAFFMTPEDYTEITTTGGEELSPYFTLQVMKVTRDGGVSQKQYDEFVKKMEVEFGANFDRFWDDSKAEIYTLTERAESSAAESFGVEMDFEPDKPVVIDTERVSEEVFMSVWMQDAAATTGEHALKIRQVNTSTSILVHGRVLVLMGYRRYKDKADIESLVTMSREWAAEIVQLNQ
jgi:hypothetical protein